MDTYLSFVERHLCMNPISFGRPISCRESDPLPAVQLLLFCAQLRQDSLSKDRAVRRTVFPPFVVCPMGDFLIHNQSRHSQLLRETQDASERTDTGRIAARLLAVG